MKLFNRTKPKLLDTRSVRRFAFIPTYVGSYIAFLEFYDSHQVYKCTFAKPLISNGRKLEKRIGWTEVKRTLY